ncbi:MAG: hypothetical protein C0598_05025 [Marinilabiliales bacterium]|nr:MAG: hypothetical protein C0598_05025 [Marinilabiliales bacterium]
MNHLKLFAKLLLVISLFISYSCSTNTVYNETRTIDEEGWNKNDIARFDVVINDSLSYYDYYINVRHTVDYRYSNLYIFMNTTYPNGNIGRDTVEFVLADKSGKWYGTGWGDVKDISVPIVKGMKFPLKGGYTFQIQQAMRVDILKEINDIGIRIEHSK